MELTTSQKVSFVSDELIDLFNKASLLPEVIPPQEELINYSSTFTTGNGTELNFEFHCSNSTEARDHIEGLAICLQKDIQLLSISGERWNAETDQLKRVITKQKMELEFLELGVNNSTFFLVKPDFQQDPSNGSK